MVSGNVVLTGFMGTGKSTVGRVLARRLGRRFVDTDALIVERHGPIPAIFAEHGEGFFRQLERDVAAELAECDDLVVATGGRMLVDPVNAAAFEATGTVVCLTASVDEIVRRVGGDPVDRPVLAGGDVRARVSQLLAERGPAYARFTAVDTDGRSPGEIAAAVMRLLDAAAR